MTTHAKINALNCENWLKVDTRAQKYKIELQQYNLICLKGKDSFILLIEIEQARRHDDRAKKCAIKDNDPLSNSLNIYVQLKNILKFNYNSQCQHKSVIGTSISSVIDTCASYVIFLRDSDESPKYDPYPKKNFSDLCKVSFTFYSLVSYIEARNQWMLKFEMENRLKGEKKFKVIIESRTQWLRKQEWLTRKKWTILVFGAICE